ncbi:uncharacterized protein [Dermacentor andersoni]|uniref:uncharacterized protein n=1 Tax=Dermacentor andersoni TaxID=34620 RepID=UPI003B3A8CAA
MQDATDLALNLITDPAYPTRIGNSVTRDTTPDLTFRQGPKLDIEEWSTEIVNKVENATKEVETDERVHRVDSRLAHLIAAKQSILSRWKTQRTNRQLRKKVAELNREIESHSRVLCTQQWNEVCNAADGQMHCGKTWSMLRHLLDATTTKSHQHHNLAKIIHRALTEHGIDEVKKRLDKYLPVTPTETHPDYLGEANKWLDRDIEVWEVRVALHNLNSNSAAGPDRVTNRALKNLNDVAIENLTAYFNTCWGAGSLPRQWKAAKIILIPKPGKPPNIENLRPISLTSCVSRLNMGKRTYAYIKDFLTERTTEIIACDQRLQKKKFGSVGSPQGSVISPLLFNHVMIGVAERLSQVARVRHTIYAEDITLWVPGGSDGHIETTLQEAVDAIEGQLDGSGLVCSPSKSELLLLNLSKARFIS